MKTQNMIAVSTESKTFITELCAAYPDQPGKSKSHDLTQREAFDAVVEFAKANRNAPDGVDLLDLEVKRTLALRGETVRANSATAKLEAKEKELEELKALYESLKAKQSTKSGK